MGPSAMQNQPIPLFRVLKHLSTLSALFFAVVNDLSELNLLFSQTSVNLNLNTPQVQSNLLYY